VLKKAARKSRDVVDVRADNPSGTMDLGWGQTRDVTFTYVPAL
jgi:hypothetical protein